MNRLNLLITGANRGLGLSLTKYGLKEGYTVYATERTESDTLKKLQEEYSEKLHILKFDVTDEEAMIKEKRRLEENNVTLDIIINNVGMLTGREQSIETLDVEATLASFDINTLGPVRVIKHFLSFLKKGEGKSIVNISSDSASLTHAAGGDYPYGFGKVGVNLLTEKLRDELKNDQINVLAIHPGWMRTDMSENNPNAPLSPDESAEAIYKMIHNPPKSTSGFNFFDYHGKSMDI